MNSSCIAAAGQREDLRVALDKLYEKYNRRELIRPDPLQFVYRYSNHADMEIAGFLSACLAYGRVEQIEKDLMNLFGRMGKSPSKFISSFTNRDRVKLKGFKHRFNTGDDIADLFVLLRNVLLKHASLERFFLLGFNTTDENTITALSKFCDSLLDMHRSVSGSRASKGLAFLLAGPNKGGAAKRLNLFLRWMVRSDDVDAGLWHGVDKAKLIVPVDVHMNRLCKILGFHNRSSVSLKTAMDITQRFAEIAPADPVKYDFSLSRIGILEDCTGKRRGQCDACELFPWCLNKKDWRR